MGTRSCPSNYHIGGYFANEQVMAHGMVDTDGNFQCRSNYSPWKPLMLKGRLQYGSQHPHYQLDSEYSGLDYSLGVSYMALMTPERTKVIVANILQSITKKLSLGAEWSHRIHEGSSCSMTARYAFDKFDVELNPEQEIQPEQATCEPSIVVSLHSVGILSASYHHPVSKRTELATEIQVMANERIQDATACVGAKFDFRQSTFRTMLDSNGRISSLLELKLNPGISFLLSGELDHVQNQSRFGFSMQFEI